MSRAEGTHACPAGCGAQVAQHQYACRDDWYRLPKPHRDAIWTAYRTGTTREHLDAMAAAQAWYDQNPRPVGGPTECRSCHAPVIGALTVNRKWMPVDPDPVEGGNLALTPGNPPTVAVIKKGQSHDGPRYVSHFVSCPQADIHRNRR